MKNLYSFCKLLCCLACMYSCIGNNAAQAARYYVKPVASGSGNGSSWSNASADLCAVFLSCVQGDEVWVAAGTYHPTRDPTGNLNPADLRNRTFFIRDGVTVFGGFAGTETQPDQRNRFANATILDGLLSNALPAYHVVLAVSLAASPVKGIVLSGFQITNGFATGTGTTTVNGQAIPQSNGAGIFLYGGNNDISDNFIGRNLANGNGCGVYSLSASNLFIKNTVYGNTPSGSAFTVTGGGIAFEGGIHTIAGNTFFFNGATRGGGMYLKNCTAGLVSNSVCRNNTSNGGCGIETDGGTYTIENNTFADNSVSGSAGSCLYVTLGTVAVTNNIFWANKKNNSTTAAGADYLNAGGTNTFRFNFLQLAAGNYTVTATGANHLGTSATGNKFNTDPRFIDISNPAGVDLYPGTIDDGVKPDACSPVINAGTAITLTANTINDVIGTPRIQQSVIDAGAYEAASQSVGLTPGSLQLVKNQVSSTDYQTTCGTIITTILSTGANPIGGATRASVWVDNPRPLAFVKRHYEVAPVFSGTSATGTVFLYFTQQDFNDYNAVNVIKLPVSPADLSGIANLRVERRIGTSNDGSGLPWTYNGATTVINPDDFNITWIPSYNAWQVQIDITGFGGFFVKTASSTLPVNWISFNGNLNPNSQAVLNWTVEEQQVATYEVLQSPDGIHFTGTGSLPGLGDGQHSYTFTTPLPLSSASFFKIKQTDMNGATTYSTIIRIHMKVITSLQAYPNPFAERLQMVSALPQQVTLFDANGRLLQQISLQAGNNTVDLARLNAGIYLLTTSQGETYRILKTK